MTRTPKPGRHAADTTEPLRTQFRRSRGRNSCPQHAKPRPATGPRRRLATAGLGAIAVTGLTTLALASAAPAFAASARGSAAASTTSATAAHSAAAADHQRGHQRGQLVSVTPVRSLPTVAAVGSELTGDGFDPSSARYGVRSYRLVYRTVDAHPAVPRPGKPLAPGSARLRS